MTAERERATTCFAHFRYIAGALNNLGGAGIDITPPTIRSMAGSSRALP